MHREKCLQQTSSSVLAGLWREKPNIWAELAPFILLLLLSVTLPLQAEIPLAFPKLFIYVALNGRRENAKITNRKLERKEGNWHKFPSVPQLAHLYGDVKHGYGLMGLQSDRVNEIVRIIACSDKF
ncbi:hypothetical protein F5Y03DRAFT_390023 [Xylaria venustula]|nr:hypothetical protein F5Y03DRAFT_390023 [Xylaria venustula]